MIFVLFKVPNGVAVCVWGGGDGSTHTKLARLVSYANAVVASF